MRGAAHHLPCVLLFLDFHRPGNYLSIDSILEQAIEYYPAHQSPICHCDTDCAPATHSACFPGLFVDPRSLRKDLSEAEFIDKRSTAGTPPGHAVQRQYV